VSARVFVEGLVIVVSILLAFAIDAAWDQHVERREESEILADLSAEVDLNLQALDRLTAGHQQRIDDARRLVTMTGSELRGLSGEEVGPFFFVLFSRISFTPVDGTLSSAISSGKLHYIENDSIRNGLVAWRGLAQDTGEEAVWLHEAAFEIVEYTRGTGRVSLGDKILGRGIGEPLPVDPREAGALFADLTADPAFVDLVTWKVGLHQEYLSELIGLRERLAGIAEELKDGS